MTNTVVRRTKGGGEKRDRGIRNRKEEGKDRRFLSERDKTRYMFPAAIIAFS